jgi:hypothetical protein
MRLVLTILLHAGLLQHLWAQTDPMELCKSSRSVMGPDILLSAELGAGANAARSDRLPWRFTGRLMPTYMLDRGSGIGVSAIVGAASSQPGSAIFGARTSVRLKSLVNLTGFSLPGAEVQGAVEYGYMVGKDQAHAVAGTVGLDLVDLARVTVRTNRIFSYNSSVGRVRGQWVFELGLGRTFSLHTPPAPPVRLPDVAPELREAFTLGQTVAQAATLIPAQPPTDTTPEVPARCDKAAIERMAAFSRHDAARVHTRAELVAALDARKLDKQADTIQSLFPSRSTVPERKLVEAIVAGIQSVFPP